jgi:hypothetical protein
MLLSFFPELIFRDNQQQASRDELRFISFQDEEPRIGNATKQESDR